MADKEGIVSDPDSSPSSSQLLKIRVLALIKGIWSVDPPSDKLIEHDKAWIYNNKPLVGMQWDLGEFVWNGQ